MSAHCNRYPECGCTKEIGTKCELPDGHHLLGRKEEEIFVRSIEDIKSGIRRNEKGFPLLPDGTIDWDLTSKEKSAELDRHERIERGSSKKPHKKHATNYTPPKKRRK